MKKARGLRVFDQGCAYLLAINSFVDGRAGTSNQASDLLDLCKRAVCSRSTANVAVMSAIWQTIIGGLLATLGGLLAVWWQARHADDVARRIRSEERREAGLLTLNVEVTAMHARFDALYQAAEQGQATSQYLNAITTLANLRQLWEGSSSGVIADKAIVEAYTALDVAAHESLPEGSAGARRQRELSTGDKEVGLRFVRDLSRVLGLLGEFKREVHQKTVVLAR